MDCRKYTDDASNRLIIESYIFHGLNSVANTGDDNIHYLDIYTYAADATLFQKTKYDSSGLDGIWNTPDDTVLGYRVYE